MNQETTLVFQCPFCKGRFICPPPADGEYMVGHTKPACQEFLQWEPDEFLFQARKMIEWLTGRSA